VKERVADVYIRGMIYESLPVGNCNDRNEKKVL
jgi:hypothetical protein